MDNNGIVIDYIGIVIVNNGTVIIDIAGAAVGNGIVTD